MAVRSCGTQRPISFRAGEMQEREGEPMQALDRHERGQRHNLGTDPPSQRPEEGGEPDRPTRIQPRQDP